MINISKPYLKHYLNNENAILSNLHNTTLNFNITYLTFFKVDATVSYGGEEATKRFRKRMNLLKGFVEENNFEFVIVDSNICDYMN
jgi:hypothetical protein